MSNDQSKSAVALTESSSTSTSSSTSSNEKFRRTIAQLSSLLSRPSSEELSETWFGPQSQSCKGKGTTLSSSSTSKRPKGTKLEKSSKKGKEKQVNDSIDRECPSQTQINLKIFKTALDSGKAISGAGKDRGIPMRLVVLTLKASWHENGTWPLLGCDETNDENLSSKADSPNPKLPNSIHPSRLLLKPSPDHKVPVPELGPPMRPDPDPDEVAKRYAERGVDEELLKKPDVGNFDL